MTSNVHNQGIMHLAYFPGGKPFCGRRGAHMSTTVEKSAAWPRICVRCERIQKARQERATTARS